MPETSLIKALFHTAWPVGLVACASSGGPVDEVAERTTSISADCFTISLARDFRYLDDHNLIVYEAGRRPYHLELSQACFGLGGDPVIALRSRSDRMCGFAGDAVIVDGGFAERCSVLSVRRLDDDQLRILVDQFDREGPEGSAIEVEVAELPDDESEVRDGGGVETVTQGESEEASAEGDGAVEADNE